MNHDVTELDSFRCPLSGVNLIEAAAGTGKTYNIQNLAVRLILEKNAHIARILIVTFTEAAAAELRDRVRTILQTALWACSPATAANCPKGELERVEKLLRQAQLPLEECAARLRRALQDFDDAAISTIHGFCQKVLSEHAFESGILFNSRLEPNAVGILEELALDFYRHLRYAEPGAELRNLLLEHHGFDARSFTRLSQRFLSRPNLIAHVDFAPIDSAAHYQEQIADHARAARQAFSLELLENLPPLLRQGSIAPNIQILKHFQSAGLVPGALRQLAALRLPTLEAARLKGRSKADKEQNQAQWEAVTGQHAGFFSHLELLFEALRRHGVALKLEAIGQLRTKFAERKIRDNFQTFDDLLLRVRDGLANPDGRLLEALRGRYQAGIIDEFQDTDPVQYETFAALFGPTRTDECAWFMVGDPRQAIYAFRGGDIATYRRADQERLLAGGAKYTLSANYRSAATMIAAVNRVFADHACPFADRSITFSAIQAPLKGDAPEPSMSLDGRDDDAPLRVLYAPTENQDAMRQACAEHIHALLNSAWQLPGRDRPGVRPNDIAVLTLTGREAEEMKRLLNRKGIPAVFTRTGNLFASPDAKELLRMLETIQDPRQITRLHSALATPIGGKSLEELAYLAVDGVASSRLLEQFRAFDVQWRRRGFIAMFNALLSAFKVRERYGAIADGERKLTNLLQLGDLLQQAAERDKLTPMALTETLARNIEESAEAQTEEFEQLLETDRSAVKLMTVHGSKGLEFPIVMLPGLHLGIADDDLRRGEYHTDDGAIEFDLSQDPESSRRSKAERLQELLRLTYVAVTRAKYRCYLYWGGARSHTSALDWLFGMRSTGWSEDFFEQLQQQNAPPEIPAEFLEAPPPTVPGRYFQRFDHELDLHLPQARLRLDESWQVTSYSGLAHSSNNPTPGFDFDAEDESEGDSAAANADAILQLEGGAATGNVWHKILQTIDFTSDPSSWRPGVRRELATGGLLGDPAAAESRIDMMLEMLRQLVQTPLPFGEKALKLAEVPQNRRLNELEFCCAVRPGFPLEPLQRLIGEYVQTKFGELPVWPRRTAEAFGSGYLQGFIDLVCEHEGKIFLIDWKSNRLNGRVHNFQPERLPLAMARSLYFLQYLIYTVALVRYLRFRLGKFDSEDYRTRFGGVGYLFLRGISEAAPGRGVFYDLPPFELIDAIDHMFDGALL